MADLKDIFLAKALQLVLIHVFFVTLKVVCESHLTDVAAWLISYHGAGRWGEAAAALGWNYSQVSHCLNWAPEHLLTQDLVNHSLLRTLLSLLHLHCIPLLHICLRRPSRLLPLLSISMKYLFAPHIGGHIASVSQSVDFSNNLKEWEDQCPIRKQKSYDSYEWKRASLEIDKNVFFLDRVST